jgi:hypothetical protein
MLFEWDESKREANLAKHGIDFVDAVLIFDGPVLERPDVRQDYGEARIGAFGKVEGRVLLLLYTWRGKKRRLISARKAGSDERKEYQAFVDAQGAGDKG